MIRPYRRQADSQQPTDAAGQGFEAVVSNPNLKLVDQVRELLRLRHYSIPTIRMFCPRRKRDEKSVGLSLSASKSKPLQTRKSLPVKWLPRPCALHAPKLEISYR